MSRLKSNNVVLQKLEIDKLRYQLSQYRTLLGVCPFDKEKLKGDQGIQGPKGDKGDPGTTSWSGITDKPTSFTPSTHSHTIAQVTGLQSALNAKENSFTKNTAFNKSFGTTSGTVSEGNHTHNSIKTLDGATRAFKEITKTAYDALATKDASTIYIIIN